MTINMPCVGCVDFNLKRPWVISCDISSEQRSMHIYRTITEWAEQQSELGNVPANERWSCERHSIRFLPQRRKQGELQKTLKYKWRQWCLQKGRKKTLTEVITLFFHGINILRSLMQTAVVLWKFHEPVANCVLCPSTFSLSRHFLRKLDTSEHRKRGLIILKYRSALFPS